MGISHIPTLGWSKPTAVEARAVGRIPECRRLGSRLDKVIASYTETTADCRRQRGRKMELSEHLSHPLVGGISLQLGQ
ncbi:hypothetical protein ACLQ28_32940 [Micromonospora sp. DT201]|uniref:hypothetical protein n=1 Tax=Micromonospora sp. DT201 TaxID=3393442 RepID=UPI003CF36306